MTDPQPTRSTRNVPASALRFEAADALSFAEADESGRTPIKMFARSAEPVGHPYWGKIVHDLSGMFLRKKTAPIDYSHHGRWSVGDLIGVATEFEADPKKGLSISGELVSTRDGDVAGEVIAKGRAGIPFECSIDFNGPGLVLEEVGQGAKVQVNGRTFEGPGVVVRKWPLRSVAVCPFGVDPKASSQFSDSPGDDDVPVEIVTFSEEAAMADKKPAETETETKQFSEAQAKELADKAAKEASDALKAEIKQFTDAFGAENGLKWHAEGKSFQDAQSEQIKLLSEQVTASNDAQAALQEKLQSLSTGEETPLETGDSDGAGNKKKTFADCFTIRRQTLAENN